MGIPYKNVKIKTETFHKFRHAESEFSCATFGAYSSTVIMCDISYLIILWHNNGYIMLIKCHIKS